MVKGASDLIEVKLLTRGIFSYQGSSDDQTPLKYEPSAMSNRTQAAELDSKDS
jgi:hypothetical protein